MGIFNFTKGGFTGSVGVHTGRNWKGKQVLAPKTAPSYSRTDDQAKVRDGFGRFNHWVSIFAPEIRYDTSLDISGRTVRTAIIKANKENIANAEAPYEEMIINTGGRQKPINFKATNNAGIITATWSKPTSTVYTSEAKMIILIVDEDNEMCEVLRADKDAETATSTINMGTDTDIYIYAWFLDKAGSMRVGSKNVGIKLATS